MTSIEPEVINFGRYTSTETARLLGLHRDTLRKYTNLGWIKCGYRKDSAKKFYLGAEIARFWKAQI